MKREVESKGEEERYKHLNAEFQRIARRDKKAFLILNDQCEEIEKNNRMGKTRDLFKKFGYQGHISFKGWDRNHKGLIEAKEIKRRWQEYWSGLPCSLPGDLPNPGIKPRSPALQADSLPSEPPRKPTEK